MSRADAAPADTLMRFGSSSALLLAIATFAFLLWTSDRGFGLTDEGFYLVSAQFPDDIWMAATSSRMYTAQIYRLCGGDIVSMRISGLIAMLISSSVLFIGVWSRLSRSAGVSGITSPLAVLSWSLVTAGSLLYYGHFVLTPCYNLLLAIAINIASGLTLVAVSRASRGGKSAIGACLFGVGLCIGFSFFCKAPSGALLFALTVGLLVAWPGAGFAVRMRRISMVGVGFGLLLIMHFSLLQGAQAWWAEIRNSSRLLFLLDVGYGFEMLPMYAWVIAGTITSALVAFFPAYALLVVGFAVRIIVRKLGRQSRHLGSVTALLSFATFAGMGIKHGFHSVSLVGTAFALSHCALAILVLVAFAVECGDSVLSSRERRPSMRWLPALWVLTLGAGPLAAAIMASTIPPEELRRTLLQYRWSVLVEALFTAWTVVVVGVTAWAAWKRPALSNGRPRIRRREGLLVIVFLAALPLVGAFGTRNVLTVNVIHHMGPALALLLLLLVDVSRRLGGSSVLVGGGVLAAAFACAQIIVGGGQNPYDMKPVLTNTVPTEVGVPPTVLKLDPMRSQLIEGLGEVARENGFRPSDDILAFYSMPGLVFALGGKSPGAPWFPVDSRRRRAAAEFVLGTLPRERLRKAFILENTRFLGAIPDLAKFGMRFPDDYVLCGQVQFARLWKPRFETSPATGSVIPES